MEGTNPLENPRRYPGNAIWLAAGLFVVMLAIGLYYREVKMPVGTGLDVAAVTKDPSAFLGRTVTVQGEVEHVVGPRAFILEDEGPGGEILVVTTATNPTPPTADLEDTDGIRVVGEVRPFDAAKLQGEIGVSATDDRLSEVRGKPVLYAFQVIQPPADADAHARADDREE